MDTLQKVQIIAQIVSAVALLVTLSIYYLQLRLMTEQVAAMQRGSDAQHILTLVSIIESEEMRLAREVVYTTLYRKHFSEWAESELQAAARVCASFAIVGRVLRSGIVPVEPVLEGWEPVLRHCYQILAPFVREKQKPENCGPQYWIGFDWLHSQLDRPERKAQTLRRNSRGSYIQAERRQWTAEENNVN